MASTNELLEIPAVDRKTNSSSNQNAQRPNRTRGNGNRNRNRNAPAVDDAFVSMGQAPKSRIYATRKVPLQNKIVHSSLRQFSTIGYNTAMINGALIRYRAFDSMKPFEKYIETLISNVTISIKAEAEQCDSLLSEYAALGYSFNNDGEASTSEIKLFNSVSNVLIDMFLELDSLITKINYLEKCNHFPSSRKVHIERQWTDLPKNINSRILSLQSSIEKKFSVKLRDTSDHKTLDVGQVQALFRTFQKGKAEISIENLTPLPTMENKSIVNHDYEFETPVPA